MIANWKLHKFYWRTFSKSNKIKSDMYDKNWNKFKLLVMQVWQKEYQVYFPYSAKTPVIDFYYKKMISIEYIEYKDFRIWWRRSALSIDDWVNKLTF